MNEYPLLFTFREIVNGGNFVAGVVCNGRALMVNARDEGWHVSGVEPGALSELGETQLEAYFYFRQAFTHALRVFADDSRDFDDFEGRVCAFFSSKDSEDAVRWDAARQAVRAGAEADGPFKQLPKETAEEPRECVVRRLDFQPKEADVRKLAGPAEEVGIPMAKVA